MTDDNNQDRIRDAADKILMGEFVRLANDYKQGKRLTGGERSFVQRMAVRFDPSLSQGPWAANTMELASVFGCSRRTLCRWKKLPDCPRPAADEDFAHRVGIGSPRCFGRLNRTNAMPAEERVLCFERKLFANLDVFQGLSREVERFLPVITSPKNLIYLNRREAEQNLRYNRLTSYVLIICNGKILRYRRGKDGQETPLHGLFSVGIGGAYRPGGPQPVHNGSGLSGRHAARVDGRSGHRGRSEHPCGADERRQH